MVASNDFRKPSLTLFMMDLFGAAHGWDGDNKANRMTHPLSSTGSIFLQKTRNTDIDCILIHSF